MESHPFIDFQGKHVIVTGATSGIGQAISVELRRRGAQPVLIGRDYDKLRETALLLGVEDNSFLALDLCESEKIHDTIIKLSHQTGRIYGLCHSAGVVDTRPLHSCSVESVKSIMEVNYNSGIELARAVCRRDVMDEGGGSVLFIASIYGLIGMAGEITYSASKGAILSAARAMAIELARRNIRVNSLSPGLVRTKMTDKAFSILSKEHREEIERAHPLGTGTPEDVARAAVFLLAPQNRWITGTNMIIDGGYTAR